MNNNEDLYLNKLERGKIVDTFEKHSPVTLEHCTSTMHLFSTAHQGLLWQMLYKQAFLFASFSALHIGKPIPTIFFKIDGWK